MALISFGILTVSDTCFANIKEDLSGPKLKELIVSSFPDGRIIFEEIVPDNQSVIADKLVEWSRKKCDVILTNGGTGFSPRDVTPEATRSVIDKETPGISHGIITKNLKETNFAMLSRAVAGIRDKTLIINFPGSVKAVTESFANVKTVIPHAVALIKDESKTISKDHEKIQKPQQPSNTSSKVKIICSAQRNRHSPYPMLEVSKALEIIFNECQQTNETEIVNIENAMNRILAEDVYAETALPPFPASIKDGYAVKTNDGAGIRFVKDAVAAGDNPSGNQLASGEVIRISTGAAIPEGADAVVQVEDTTLIEATADSTKELKIEIKIAPKKGQDIRPIGCDIAANSLVLCKGDKITVGHVGVLATVGKVQVKVYKRPSIGILSTGNELLSPYEELKPGHIRDSNKLTLLNLLKQYNFNSNDCGVARDEPNAVKNALEEALKKNDVVITTGGVSMGEFDIIKQVLMEDFSAKIHFGRVNMKPGKPTTFATCRFYGNHKVIFGLPGNPVSATVTSILFVLPALWYYERNKHTKFPRIKVTLGVDVRLDPRPEYMRVALKSEINDDKLQAYPTGDQISSRINSFIGASALLIVPGKNTAGYKDICPKGVMLDAYLFDPLNFE